MTVQVPDILLHNGEKIPLAYSSAYPPVYGMEDAPPLPQNHPHITRTSSPYVNSGCWRGYQGIWEIRAGHLYLTGFESGMFQLQAGEPLLADWVSGILRRQSDCQEIPIRHGAVVSRTRYALLAALNL